MNEPIIDRELEVGRGFGARSAFFERRDGEPPALDAADRTWVAITDAGALRGYPVMRSPGRDPERSAARAVLARESALHEARARTRGELVRRLGGTAAELPRLTCSVVVCTHRRPQLLERCLDALARLDPAPLEVIVVDNRPGPAPARAVAERFGARYAVEDRGGHNAARRLGAALATGDLVAFTDDDCRAPAHWLASASALMGDRSIAATCGPVIAADVSLPEQEERERLLPFPRFDVVTRFDFSDLPAVGVGAIGCGANMIVRRSELEPLGVCLPDDLEGGTPARSGGDLYLLYRLMAAGHQLVHDPGSWVAHEHRTGKRAVERTAQVYGTGFAAFLTKVLVEHGELAAPPAWTWLARRLSSTLLLHTVAPDRSRLGVMVSYIAGGLRGPSAWARARRRAGRLPPRPAPSLPPGEPQIEPGVSLIAHDSPAARNAAARAAATDVLVFLASDARAADGLAAAHAAAQRARPGVVVGAEDATPAPGGGLASRRSAMLANRRAHLAASALAATVDDLPTSNFSIPRELFLALGGFDERLSGRGAARELAYRALRAGADLTHEPRARSLRVIECTTAAQLDDARAFGRDCALMSRDTPELAAGLEMRGMRDLRHAPTLARRCAIVGSYLMRARALTPLVLAAAATFERLRQRRMWVHLVKVAERAAFAGAWAAADGRPAPAPFVLELSAPDVLPEPTVTPLLEIRSRGRRIGLVRPHFGCWNGAIADQILAVAGHDHHPTIAPAPPASAPGALDGWAVAVAAEDDAAAFRALGADVHVVGGARVDAATHWRRVVAALRDAPADFFAIPLAGTRADPAWLTDVAAAAAAGDVAVITGGATAPGAPHEAGRVERARPELRRYRLRASAPRYVVVARRHLEALGGLDPDLGAFGTSAPAIALAQRALESGLAAVWLDTYGLAPALASARARRAELRAANRATAALHARDARRAGRAHRLALELFAPWLAGPLPRPLRILHRPKVGTWLIDGADHAAGALHGWRRTTKGPAPPEAGP